MVAGSQGVLRSCFYLDAALLPPPQVELEVAPSMPHCYPLLTELFPEADAAAARLAAFVRRHTAQ